MHTLSQPRTSSGKSSQRAIQESANVPLPVYLVLPWLRQISDFRLSRKYRGNSRRSIAALPSPLDAQVIRRQHKLETGAGHAAVVPDILGPLQINVLGHAAECGVGGDIVGDEADVALGAALAVVDRGEDKLGDLPAGVRDGDVAARGCDLEVGREGVGGDKVAGSWHEHPRGGEADEAGN